MNIGLPLVQSGNNNSYTLAPDFSDSDFFGIYNSKSQQLKVISEHEISGMQSSNYFTGFIQQQDIKVVISPMYSIMLMKFFKDNNIEIYKADGENIDLNIKLFCHKMLPQFTIKDIGFPKACSSSCHSCKDICKN